MCPYYLDGELLPRPKARSVLYAAAPGGTDGANTLFGLCAVFKLRRGRRAEVFRSRSLKTEQRSVAPAPSTRLSRHQRHVRSTLGKCLPRKEVIQPQLPLRLPCYDFTPITSPTFDGCLP